MSASDISVTGPRDVTTASIKRAPPNITWSREEVPAFISTEIACQTTRAASSPTSRSMGMRRSAVGNLSTARTPMRGMRVSTTPRVVEPFGKSRVSVVRGHQAKYVAIPNHVALPHRRLVSAASSLAPPPPTGTLSVEPHIGTGE